MTTLDVVATTTTPVTFTEPEGIAPRGTLIVLTAPGETAPAYNRFGRRLAVDAYRVSVIEDDHVNQARLVFDQEDLVAPVVLVGSDQAAHLTAEIAQAQPSKVAAVILAGIRSAVASETVVDEISARTSCPNHQRVLAETSRGSLFDSAPVLTSDVASSRRLDVPALALHGSDDQLSPLEAAREQYRDLGVDELHVIDGGLHDILNDVTHRSVAATIVLFLERLRLARGLQPLVSAERL